MRNEIKFLYNKKHHLNTLDNAFVWDKLWAIIESNINNKLEIVMEGKYSVQKRKLDKLRELKQKNRVN
jgi:hypothetical protein